MRLLDFDIRGHDIFRRWYIDGRVFYHKVIDRKSPRKGIQELRYVDPSKIKKVRESTKEPKKGGSAVELVKKVEDYYLYNDKGISYHGTVQGVKIAPHSIA